MNNIIEVKDFLPRMYEQKLYENIYDSEHFIWNYLKSITFRGEKRTSVSFSNVVFSAPDKIMTQAFDMVFPLICYIPEISNIEIENIIRIRIGLILKNSEEEIHPPHVDFEDLDHFTALYYFNDSDGDTILYKEKHPEFNPEHKNFTIKKRITPERGKLVIFDGKQYHSSSSPTKTERRVVMNINFSGRMKK